jgi:hypothetical protein
MNKSIALLGEYTPSFPPHKTKILVDGGDPDETRRVKALLGFVDGQTTNPTLIAKNPAIRQRIASRHRLSSREENEAYKKIVQSLSPMVGEAGVSIEVFAESQHECRTDAGPRSRDVFVDSERIYQIPVHTRRPASGGTVGAQKHSREHDVVFLTGKSCRGVRGNERFKRARVCLSVRWETR